MAVIERTKIKQYLGIFCKLKLYRNVYRLMALPVDQIIKGIVNAKLRNNVGLWIKLSLHLSKIQLLRHLHIGEIKINFMN